MIDEFGTVRNPEGYALPEMPPTPAPEMNHAQPEAGISQSQTPAKPAFPVDPVQLLLLATGIVLLGLAIYFVLRAEQPPVEEEPAAPVEPARPRKRKPRKKATAQPVRVEVPAPATPVPAPVQPPAASPENNDEEEDENDGVEGEE